ncbi:Co2+/Mg2+ efflux protein ApaG [Alteromonas sp. a30]|uniref:Co2+/Mg2+ efflux protein ApaG n=1 Tax=Alteromonas sp. a30 TaxID=2730917 RepID=UPI002282807A|nr:Co2+/Mg2+ efflux protein ApaG [Alteromonas sp. a30]MCY7294444.1 Co2+/Mg2+ efflux protein ApaG [Alteromonas sp. a30]
MSSSVTDNISVEAKTAFMPDHPATRDNQFAFSYEITIVNNSDTNITLLNRYWLITDADGKKMEVQGAGVIGEQPVIKIGSSYSYTSGAVLDTPVGAMEGHYEMQLENGKKIRVPIPPFGLAIPNAIN